MTDAISARSRLDELALELDTVSKQLGTTEEQLEPVEADYRKRLDEFECGCWDRHHEHGDKLPSEALREKLARRTMPGELRDKYDTLQASRRRLQRRISDLKAEVDAQRSILSALKAELEAVG